MEKIWRFAWPVLLCFGLGFVASALQDSALDEWYPYLRKSALTPPTWVFPTVWSILYVMIGLSLSFLLDHRCGCSRRVKTLWAVQLVLNFLWSVLFFFMRNPLLGLFDILLLDVVVFSYIFESRKFSRTASWLFVPYVLWLLLATYLNAYIYLHN